MAASSSKALPINGPYPHSPFSVSPSLAPKPEINKGKGIVFVSNHHRHHSAKASSSRARPPASLRLPLFKLQWKSKKKRSTKRARKGDVRDQQLQILMAATTLLMLSQDPSNQAQLTAATTLLMLLQDPSDQPQLLAAATAAPPLNLFPEIRKKLTASDVGGNDRLMLSTKLVKEKFLSAMDEAMAQDCRSPAGREFQVWDADKGSSHNLILKKRASNPSFVLIGQWVNNFVKRRELKKGDTVQLTFDGTRIIFKLLIKNKKGHSLH